MERSWDSSGRPTFAARFDGGPRHGTVAFVVGLDSGQPPDVLRTPGRSDGFYLLAGGPRGDGSLPYWWMTRQRLPALRTLRRPRPAGRVATIP